MARLHHRIFALVGALLFLGSTVAITAGILWQMHQSNQTNPQTNQTNQGAPMQKLSNFNPISKIDSLQTTDTQVGTGEVVTSSSKVTVKYTGAYASDGSIFDSSDLHGGQPITFALDGVIQGWTQGIPGMKTGGKRRLLIPAAMAYGASPPQGIRANADMVFDVELIAVQNP